jgi:hypothetical protein
MAKTASIGIRVEPGLKEALEKLAAADRRTLAAYIEIVLEKHLADLDAAGNPLVFQLGHGWRKPGAEG